MSFIDSLQKSNKHEEIAKLEFQYWKETREAIGRFDQMIHACTLRNFALTIGSFIPAGVFTLFSGKVTFHTFGIFFFTTLLLTALWLGFFFIWLASLMNALRYQRLMNKAVDSAKEIEKKISKNSSILITNKIEETYNQKKQSRNLICTHLLFLF